jgi:MoaA/NifB/PqqE/SkfB family radical SAM enzyme
MVSVRKAFRPVAHAFRSVLGLNGVAVGVREAKSGIEEATSVLYAISPQLTALNLRVSQLAATTDRLEALLRPPVVPDPVSSSPPRFPVPNHPLAKHSGAYSEQDVSYFMHRGRFRPLMISIETINICNNDCVICPYSAQTRKRRTMTRDLFEKAIRDYGGIGGGPVSLTPLVGEAFLDKHLLGRLAFMRKTPSITKVSVTTNAVMVSRYDDDELKTLLQHIDRVKVSVYGLDREEYAIMTKKDEYDVFRHSLIRILSLANPESVVIGIRQLRQRSQEAIDLWKAEIERDAGVAVEIASYANEYANWSHFDTLKPLPLGATWRPVSQNTKQCGIPLLGVQIMSDGRVSFCACANFDGTPDLVIGDLNENSLAEILDSSLVADLWDWPRCGVPEFCKSCSFHLPLEQIASVGWAYRDPTRFIGG